MKQHALYNEERCHAFVCDISQKEWTVPFPAESLDVVILLFVMSALDPEDMTVAVNNLEKYLKLWASAQKQCFLTLFKQPV